MWNRKNQQTLHRFLNTPGNPRPMADLRLRECPSRTSDLCRTALETQRGWCEFLLHLCCDRTDLLLLDVLRCCHRTQRKNRTWFCSNAPTVCCAQLAGSCAAQTSMFVMGHALPVWEGLFACPALIRAGIIHLWRHLAWQPGSTLSETLSHLYLISCMRAD